MITDDQDPEMEIRAFFEHDLELTVTRIPVSVLRSADFLVDGDGAGYVLEVKARSDDKESIAALRAGEVVAGAESLGWARWASDGVRSAGQQFASSNPPHDRLWILCFVVKRSFATDAVFDQIIGTLYDVRQVAYSDSDEGSTTSGRNCLHVVPGAFERWPEIDAAIVAGSGAITLCANECGDRLAQLYSSCLYNFFAERGGPITPSDLELTKGFWSVSDRSLDRSDQSAVERYLAEKYKTSRVFILDIKGHYASAVVPDNRHPLRP